MKNRELKPVIVLFLVLLAGLVGVLPAAAACNEIGCCPEESSELVCTDCLLGACDESDPDLAVVKSHLVLDQPCTPLASIPVVQPDRGPLPGGIPTAPLPAFLTTTVLRI